MGKKIEMSLNSILLLILIVVFTVILVVYLIKDNENSPSLTDYKKDCREFCNALQQEYDFNDIIDCDCRLCAMLPDNVTMYCQINRFERREVIE